MLFTDINILDEISTTRPINGWASRTVRRLYRRRRTWKNAADYGEVYDGCGRLLMPALYNAHTHLPMTLLRGYAGERAPCRNGSTISCGPSRMMTPEDNYWATKLALAEMARYGSVSASDMY